MKFPGRKQDRSMKGRLKRLLHRASIGVIGAVAAAPLFIAPLASAAPNTTYTPLDFTQLGLTPDRSAPSGGFTVTPDLLTMNVDNTKANPAGHFYQTEGLQSTTPLNDSTSIRAKLFVDKDWQSKPTQAGLWAIAGNTTDTNEIGWPILQFTSNNAGSTGFRTYNTFSGDWSGTANFDSDKGWNKWYTMEITITPQNVEFYVNNTKVGSYAATSGSDTFNVIHGVIFNNFNEATGNPADNYAVKWQNFETGLVTKNDKEACKNGGYLTMTDNNNQPFKNQGQCVSYMNGRPDNGNTQPVTTQNLQF